MKRKALLLGTLLGLAAPVALAGAVSYDFTDFWNIDTPNTVPDHVTASAFSGWSSCFTDTFSPWNYVCGTYGPAALGFTVQAEAGWQLDALTFAFDGYTLGDPADSHWAVYTSLDNFTTALGAGQFGYDTAGIQHFSMVVGASGLTGPLELRIVGDDGGHYEGWFVDGLRLDLDVKAVPEPASLALVAAALLAGSATLRHRHIL